MSDKNTAPAAEKPEATKTKDAAFAQVRILQKQLDAVVAFLERTFAFDVNKDGKIGAILIAFAISALTCLGVSPITSPVFNLPNANGTNDLLQVDSSGNLAIDGSLTADNLSTAQASAPLGTFGTGVIQTNLTVSGAITTTAARVLATIVAGNVTSTGSVTVTTIANGGGTNGTSLAGFQSIAAGTAVAGTNAPASTNAMIWISVTISNRPCYLGLIPANQ